MASLLPPDSLDPGATYLSESWRLLHLLGDGLLAFESFGASNATLVPDLATSIPTPTDGGHTYTFKLRSGIRYSNGDVVAPADFRRALERGFPLNESAHEGLYGGLVGAEACVRDPDKCDLSQGVETDDATGTITFHLVVPDPEFLYKLTPPFAYPVPPSTRDTHQARAGVPGTGPYMLVAPRTHAGSRFAATHSSTSGHRRLSQMGSWTGSSGRSGSSLRHRSTRWPLETSTSHWIATWPRRASRISSCGPRRRSIPLRRPRPSTLCSTPRHPLSMTSMYEGR